MHLYHSSRNLDLTNGATPKDSVLKGRFFSDSPEEQYGRVTYRTTLPDAHCLLTDSVLHELSFNDRVEWTKDRNGDPLVITQDGLNAACRQAMDELGIDAKHFESVYECAIENASCDYSNHNELEGELEDGDWTLQNVRGMTAHNLGLAGAEMEDDTGRAYMLMGSFPLEKVEYSQDASDELADENGYVPAASRTQAAAAPLDQETLNRYLFLEVRDAGWKGSPDRLNALLKQGADVNHQEPNGTTAAMVFAGMGNSACLDALIAAGADLELKNEYGYTALMMASLGCNDACIEQLVKAGADESITKPDRDGMMQTAEDMVPRHDERAPACLDAFKAGRAGRKAAELDQKLDQACDSWSPPAASSSTIKSRQTNQDTLTQAEQQAPVSRSRQRF